MPTLAAVSVVGNDRPGIVAAITRGLFELGCNLEDATSSILRGHFAMMLIVQLPEGVDPAALERTLAPAAADLELVVTARPVQEAESRVAPASHIVSVYGADRPGIVFKVAELLAARGANITALSSRILGEDVPVYALVLEVAAGPDADLESDLAGLQEELGMDVTVHPVDPDVL